MAPKTLKWIPIGGLGEVGKNMMMFEYDGQILLIDAGVMFPENDMLGIDAVIPDYNFIKERKQDVAAHRHHPRPRRPHRRHHACGAATFPMCRSTPRR